MHEERNVARSKLYAAAVECTADAMVMEGRDGLITGWNAAAERVYGYRAEEVIGSPVQVIVPNERRKEVDAVLKRLYSGEQVETWETVRRHRDGHLLLVSLSIAPLRNETGEVVGVVSAARDVTSGRAMIEKLLAERDALERSNAALEDFASIASHDLQEPVRVVASFAELLSQHFEGKVDEKADKYIHYVVDGAKRMQRLIADLLDYSRVGSGAARFEAVDLDALVASAVEDLESAVVRAGAVVTRDPLPTVLGDESLLRQLFQNLLTNALKFRGDAPPKIHIGARHDGHRVRLSVADNGIGVEPAYANRLFRMFQRLHDRAKYEGNGIGLAISKRIVEHHGGRIEFDSKPGAGTTFYFTLSA